MKRQKTIFITSFFGLIARNILATDVLEILRRQPDLKIVILAPESKQDQYSRRFGSENVIVEGVKIQKTGFMERFFTVLFHHLSDTSAWRIHRLIFRKEKKNYFSFCVYWFLSKLGYLKAVRRLARWLDYHLVSKDRFRGLFYKYQPNLVFATDIFEPDDVDLMREARYRSIFIVGMVRSWDNITSKGLNRIIPDKLIVNTPKIKEEAIKYNDVKAEDIDVVGIPHYDRYLFDKRTPREEVFRKLNLDSSKKTVFFAPPADLYSQDNEFSVKLIKALSVLEEVQLLIRLYIVGRVVLGDIKAIANKIAIDDPGAGADFKGADLTAGDSHLADLLYHSDVVVAFASTLAIDAIVFNKPVIFVGFDSESDRPYWRSLKRFYDYDHQKSILKTGGIKLAKNMDELISDVKEYLANPKIDEEGRKRIIEERCWKLDGKSGKRLAETILKFI